MTAKRVHVIDLHRKLDREQKIVLGHLTYSASKLWNIVNYAVREKKKELSCLEKEFKDNFWARNLHSQSAQAVVQKVVQAWKSFFKGKNPKNRPPGYQPKNGHFPVKWKRQGFKIITKGGETLVRLSISGQTKDYLKEAHGIESAYLWIEIPKSLSLGSAQEIEIVPHSFAGDEDTYYAMHIIYEKQIPEIQNYYTKWMAIDPGVINLAACVSEQEPEGLIVSGRRFLSQLRWWNKETAKAKSILDHQDMKGSKRLSHIFIRRRNVTRDFLQRASGAVIDWAERHGVTDIAVGNLPYRVTESNIGHLNNQKLHQMPLGRFVNVLSYKAGEKGITVHAEIPEDKTSETCCVCGIERKANRIKRGLYRCKSCGAVINADINAAVNILKKVVPNPDPNFGRDRDSGFGRPWRVRVLRGPNLS